MSGPPVERKLAAILSADVEGYSRLMGDDEVATVRTITEYREAIASSVAGHGGRVVDAPGDNVLDPHYPFFYLWTLGHASYMSRRNGDAVDAFKKITQQNPNFLPAHAYLAVLFAEIGREKAAREAWDKARQLSPGVSLASLSQRLPYRRPADLDRLLTAANKGGLH
jgi:class 3 adenylate cyclase